MVASVPPSVRPFELFELFRGSALPSAAKSKEESLSVQDVCLCVDLLRGCGRSAFNVYSFCSVEYDGFAL